VPCVKHLLQELEAAFNADVTAGAGVVAAFIFAGGISSLAWGPFCDLMGRKPTYLASTTLYAGATLGCIFAKNIGMLLVFRALQGVARECTHYSAASASDACCAAVPAVFSWVTAVLAVVFVKPRSTCDSSGNATGPVALFASFQHDQCFNPDIIPHLVKPPQCCKPGNNCGLSNMLPHLTVCLLQCLSAWPTAWLAAFPALSTALQWVPTGKWSRDAPDSLNKLCTASCTAWHCQLLTTCSPKLCSFACSNAPIGWPSNSALRPP
jgi:hypothetical protein